MRCGRVDLAEMHGLFRRQHQPEQADLFRSNHLPLRTRPVRIEMLARQQMRQLGNGPVRLDRGIGHAPHFLRVQQRGGQNPRRRFARQRRTRERHEPALPRGQIVALFRAVADLGRQPRQQCAVQRLIGRRTFAFAATGRCFGSFGRLVHRSRRGCRRRCVGIGLAFARQSRGTVQLATRGSVGVVAVFAGGRTGTGQQWRQHRVGRLFAPAQFFAQQPQLPMQLAPLAHAQETEEMPVAPVAQLGLGKIFMHLPVRIPQAQDADEFRARIGKQRMRVIGRFARLRRALARILDAQECGDDDHLAQAPMLLRGHQHARQLDVHRQARHLAAGRGQTPLRIDGAQLQ